MNSTISIVLLLVGIVLLLLGVSESESIASDLSEFFTGRFSDKAMWLLVGGSVVALIGLAGLIRAPRGA